MGIEQKLDLATQEAIILGAVRAMTHGPHMRFNAMRREGDNVVVFYDATRDPATRRHPSLTRRVLAWSFPRWFAFEQVAT